MGSDTGLRKSNVCGSRNEDDKINDSGVTRGDKMRNEYVKGSV